MVIEGRPYCIPILRKADSMALAERTFYHEYLPTLGLKQFSLKLNSNIIE